MTDTPTPELTPEETPQTFAKPKTAVYMRLSERKELLLICSLLRAGCKDIAMMPWPRDFSQKFVNAINVSENEVVRGVEQKELGNIARAIHKFSNDSGVGAYRQELNQEMSLLAAIYFIGTLLERAYSPREGLAINHLITACTQASPVLLRDTTQNLERVNTYAEVLLSAAENHGFIFAPRLTTT